MAKHDHNGITRTQRRKLRKEEKQTAQKRAKRKKAFLRWSLRSVAGILPLVILYVVFLHKPDVSNAGILRMAKLQHNFGFIPVRGGIASTEIPLVNIGEGPLTITALDSSCGCTTASIINHGVEGPSFGMAGHGSNPKNWQTVINPGEQAVLKVYYNPTVHPDLRGPVTRVVTIYSDDPENPQQEVRIKVNQIG
jgi:hypothetical protein